MLENSIRQVLIALSWMQAAGRPIAGDFEELCWALDNLATVFGPAQVRVAGSLGAS